MRKGQKTMKREMDIFDLPSEWHDEFNSTPTPYKYANNISLDAYVRMITCGKGYPNGKIPSEVVERYNKCIKK
jgi:hypothetical protein|tara:strand:+ start:118 stop:336 length:219 start_codon:yes stop_codon:yes gene_type:complete